MVDAEHETGLVGPLHGFGQRLHHPGRGGGRDAFLVDEVDEVAALRPFGHDDAEQPLTGTDAVTERQNVQDLGDTGMRELGHVRRPLEGPPALPRRFRIGGIADEYGQGDVSAELPVTSPPQVSTAACVDAELCEQPITAVADDSAGCQRSTVRTGVHSAALPLRFVSPVSRTRVREARARPRVSGPGGLPTSEQTSY